MFVEVRSPQGAAVVLPGELAFLLGQGVDLGLVREAALLARREGAEPVAALLRAGLMSETDYYAALARALGRPFRGAGLVLHADARFPDDIRLGAAVGAAGEVFLAPPPGAVAALLAAGAPHGAVLTTPAALSSAVLATAGPRAAARAAEALEVRAPDWAYRPGLHPGQILVLLLGLAAALLLLDAGPWLRLAALALLNFTFLAVIVFRLAAPLLKPAPLPDPAPVPEAELPVYTVLVALYRETKVVPRLVGALARLDYPASKLDLKFVIEADDAATAAALAALPLPARFEVVTAPAGLPRTKPRALNVALPLARGEHLVVYDAEDVPDPGQLKAAAALFRAGSDRLACLQGRLVIDNTNDSWLTRCFTLEYAALFDVLLPLLTAAHLPVPLGGTTTHFRTRVLRELHGWDAWNVTEDADLGLRLSLAGYRVGDLPLSTLEEAPARVRPWLRQRIRWMKGFVQTTITHSRHPVRAFRRLGPLGLLCAVAMVPGTVVSALAYPFGIALAVWHLTADPLPEGPDFVANLVTATGATVFVAGLGAMGLPALAGCLRRGWWSLAPWVLMLPFYYGLVSAAAWLGLLELLVAPYRWNKTEHGLSATSRTGAMREQGVRAGAPPRRRRPWPGASG
ncbi:glycosyltransferase family 2 protein [Methylobacterium sp. 17Sr1-1]|uniref:glycosyltransferase family 2 protein n=1 Tax=Methylobacterium sp. 17Sr1-1 TaxID=2202826 RepID=UPI000D6FCDA5|nr:glycosyltransferase family 2 protein [Methylobacterium sp. 17Sr1-1]AWN53998.1 glycosyl transferase [Methylobacterium sp. 17Sr1-1]